MPSIAIDTASNGDTTLVAAITGRTIRVLGLHLASAGAVTATLKSGSNKLTGAVSMITGTPHVWQPTGSYDVTPWAETVAGEALILTLSGAVQVSGRLIYDVV